MSIFFNVELDENGEDIWKDAQCINITNEFDGVDKSDLIQGYKLFQDEYKSALENMHKTMLDNSNKLKDK